MTSVPRLSKQADRRYFRWIVLLQLLVAAGCSINQTPPQPIDPVEVIAQRVDVVEPVPVKKQVQKKEKAKPTAPPPTVLTPQTIAVVLSDNKGTYDGILSELRKWLTGRDYSVFSLDDNLENAASVVRQIEARNSTVVVAVGLRAAETVGSQTSIPVIFCQVFNYSANQLVSENVKGVSVIPPLSDQLALWRGVNPNLRTIGAIVGDGHADLLSHASKTVTRQGLKFEHHVATSNMETLYLFKRMAPKIDGFWLFPDNRVLSASVIRDLLTYSIRHGVQVTVFTPALLEQGAYMSATGTNRDIALKILSILDQISVERFAEVPAITPLSELKITWNTWLPMNSHLEANRVEY
ncbi:MAG: ABC transporter substrate binding protein [Pseudomonadota bacterium]